MRPAGTRHSHLVQSALLRFSIWPADDVPVATFASVQRPRRSTFDICRSATFAKTSRNQLVRIDFTFASWTHSRADIPIATDG
jgi:hypothetical protein